jgi:Domain of unknown function (DUF222)/HNH endonuclease
MSAAVAEVGCAVALGDEIALLAAQLDAGTHRLLACIREFDVSEEWHHQGAQSCAHWLTWRIGLDTATAREKVRVARALGLLPAVDSALATGRLSYAKVRAITRVATPETEGRLLEMALFTTGAQMERICRRFRSLRNDLLEEGGGDGYGFGRARIDEADGERGVRIRSLASGMVRLEITLQADEADLVVKAIEKARDELRAQALARTRSPDRDSKPALGESLHAEGATQGDASAETPTVVPVPDETRHGRPDQRSAGVRVPLPGRADGLMYMAEASLRMSTMDASQTLDSSGGAQSRNNHLRWGGDRYRVLIHLDRGLLGSARSDTSAGQEESNRDRSDGPWDAYLEDGTQLSAETFRRVSCDGGLVPVIDSGTDNVLDVGRQTRAIPTAIRRALWVRDHGCRFPGCANQRFVHGHHIRHWAHGGETALENLTLVCTFHHRLLHEGGFNVRRHPEDNELEWLDPRGLRIPEVPEADRSSDQEAPTLLSLSSHGVLLPTNAEVNECGWDGNPVDYDSALDALLSESPSLFA